MKQNPLKPITSRSGFALVVTLALMILLAILAVGLLSLSAVSLRSSGQGAAQAEARANARMALMIAIGELQTYTGVDTRVTAPADIFDADAPRLTGVWKSWEGTNHDSTGRPIKPDYTVKNPGSGDSRFVTWLVSGAVEDGVPTSAQPAALVSDSSTPDTVPLLAEGSLGDNDGQVHVKPQPLKDGKGRLAWWVSPENQKARLAQPHKPRSDDLAGWVEMGQSHLVPDPSPFGLEALIEDPENHTVDPNNPKAAARAITLATSEFLANGNAAEPQHNFHDLSTSAVGLLTNTATGGWRKDLSLLTEKWDDIYATYPGGKLPLFRFSPAAENTSLAPKPRKPSLSAKVSDTNQAAAEAATPPQSAFYPWSRYSTIIGYIQPCTYHAASASWASLQSFATSYKGFTYYSGEVKSDYKNPNTGLPSFQWDKIAKNDSNQIFASEIYNHKHQQRLYPQIARFQLLVYATAIEDPNRLGQKPKRYQLRLNYVPLFTLWNPHNVTLEHHISGTVPGGPGTQQKFLGFGWRRSLPGVLAAVDSAPYIAQGKGPDDVPFSQYKMLSAGNFQTLDWPKNSANPKDFELQRNKDKWGGRRWFSPASDAWGCWLPEGVLTFRPGEAKVFSAASADAGYGFGGTTAFRLREGYNPTAIIGTEISVSSNLTADRTFWFLFRPDRVTQPYRSRDPGYGFSLSFANGSSHFGGTSSVPSSVGEEYHNITALVNESEGDKYWPPDEVDEVAYSVGELEGQWIPIVSVSFGPRMTIGTGPGMTQNRPTKGVVQNNAHAGMVLSDPGSGAAKDHPANNTFDFAYHSLSIGSNITPNLSDSQGFIATGCQSGDGLSRLVMADIPLRPMASLVELQGWNPRGNNPYPPFQMNLIGNSDATPLIPRDNIVPPVLSPASVSLNLQHDDAYCANHLLLDDWFVSSIAPQPDVLGGDIAKNIDTFYEDFLKGDETLSNRSYRPIAEDTNLTASLAAERVQKIVNSADGWLKVASRLEVDGMFNVNSTSVAAWKALLGHAKSREEIAILGKNHMESAPAYKKHPVTRGPVAPDVEAGSGPAHGGVAEKTSEYAGFRNLTDAQIEDLAEKIVEQVRLRGPFLSLAEFVNRQLSNEEDLALAGAVQTAIDNLKDDPMKVLRNPANSLSDNTMPPGDPKLSGANYEFAKAAEGSSAYGVPGWIRQADVLRPIAPILSARDDTFTIRAYGDAVDASGKVVAKAWCEAVVRRTGDFCDQADAADSIEPPSSPTNTKFGRRYQILTFRWLNKDEV